LTLEAHRPLVEVAGEAHLPVHVDEGLVGEIGNLPALPNPALGVEDLYPLVGIVL
jgi:hypothetical protein